MAHFGSFFFVIQVKGSQHLAVAAANKQENLKSALQASILTFRNTFASLDWDYMMNRENGELICDVGVTIHPVHSVPLVGLWRLDYLEASYGAGGYYQGNLHTINTLANYGGLQAAMPNNRSMRNHIIYQQSYNTSYEATRTHNNSRTLFNEVQVSL